MLKMVVNTIIIDTWYGRSKDSSDGNVYHGEVHFVLMLTNTKL